MTAEEVQYVLDELGTVVDDVATEYTITHPSGSTSPVQTKRVDRDNALLYDGGGTFDMEQSITEMEDDLKKGNYVGARFADRDSSYIGTTPNLDTESVVGVRIIGYSGSYGHVDPLGENGVPFQGTDDALVERCMEALREGLKFPDAGRTNVAFTHLTITNESPVMAAWQEYYRYDFDIVFDGFEEIYPADTLTVHSGEAYIVNEGDTEYYDSVRVDGLLLVEGELSAAEAVTGTGEIRGDGTLEVTG